VPGRGAGDVIAVILVLGHLWVLPLTLIGLVEMAVMGRPLAYRLSLSEGLVLIYDSELFGVTTLRGCNMGAVTMVRLGPGVPECLAHEQRHMRQGMVMGVFTLLVYPILGLVAKARGGHWYYDNWLERDAREHARRR
jgi:hypothetical protein